MADLDSRNKRASALLLGLGFGRVWPNPDGDLTTQSKRQHMALSYAGILGAAVIQFIHGTRMALTGIGR